MARFWVFVCPTFSEESKMRRIPAQGQNLQFEKNATKKWHSIVDQGKKTYFIFQSYFNQTCSQDLMEEAVYSQTRLIFLDCKFEKPSTKKKFNS